MPYFAPYIDETGIHMPTYEDRLADLVEAYRGIFGLEAELSAAVPDYQLLSVFARALDDTSALVLQAYNSRNPAYASGNALDLLLPQYGIQRAAGETDAEVRARIRTALSSKGSGSCDALLAAVLSARAVRDAKVYVNETDTTDANGIPAHSIAVVTAGGNAAAVAQAIWDKKAPGIGAWGSTAGTAVDAEGNEHTVAFTRAADKMAYIYLTVRVLPGGNEETIREAVRPAVLEHVKALKIAESLNVPQLYGVAYAADPSISGTFVVTDIQAAATGSSAMVRDLIAAAWNEKISAPSSVGVDITFI